MSETNQIINALLRLQRAGAEDSKATAKLKAAAKVVSDNVLAHLDADTRIMCNSGAHRIGRMPRGYTIGWTGSWGDYVEQYNNEEHQRVAVFDTRDAALAFAADIAHGWLDELAHWLEQRAAEAEKAAQGLEEKASASHTLF